MSDGSERVVRRRIRRAALLYRHLLMSKGYRPRRADPTAGAPAMRSDLFSHVLWMLNQLLEFLDAGKVEKASRWLGFIQGAFWQHGIFTVDQMRTHNTIDAELPPCCYVCHYERCGRCQLFDMAIHTVTVSDICPPSFCPLRSEDA